MTEILSPVRELPLISPRTAITSPPLSEKATDLIIQSGFGRSERKSEEQTRSWLRLHRTR